MIKPRILFPLSFLSFAFLLLIFTALRISSTDQVSSLKSLSFSTKKQKEIYEASYSGKSTEEILTYPGILPNHPFYWAKMLRDRIMIHITRNPEKRTKLYLSYADKRLAAGKILIVEGEVGLGISTITKAEKYLQKAGTFAFDNLTEKDNVYVFELVGNKYLKHRQELDSLLISEIAGDKKQALQKIQDDNIVFFEGRYLKYLKDTNAEASVSGEMK